MAIRIGGCIVICDNKSLANVCSIGLQSGNEGVCGQFLQSRGPGQPSTWNSIANLDFSAVQTIVSYSYDNRGTLRTLTTASNGAQAFVEDIGYFKFSSGVLNEIDDGETAFIVSGVGTWLLTAPTWNAIEALNTIEGSDESNRNIYSFPVCATVGAGLGCSICCFAACFCSYCQYICIPECLKYDSALNPITREDTILVQPRQGIVEVGFVSAFYDCGVNCGVIRVTGSMQFACDSTTQSVNFYPCYRACLVCDWQVTIIKK